MNDPLSYANIRNPSVISNPYSPGSRPSYLAGRGGELSTVRSHLARIKALGRSAGPLVAFHGSRGFGKTSLLRVAEQEAHDAGYLAVWATGRDDAPLAPELTRSLADNIDRGGFGEIANTLLQRIDTVQIGVPGLKVGIGTNARQSASGLGDLLRDAARFARDHGRLGLAVFIDEFQEAQLADRRSLLISLQQADDDRTGAPLGVVAAGLPSMLGAVPAAATFGERSFFIEIGPLTEVAVAEALRLPAAELGVTWSDGAIDDAVSAARGYPHHVQLLGDAAWAVARPEAGDQITAGHLRQAMDLAETRMATVFESRLARRTPEQRRVLTAMAVAAGGSEVDVPRAAIAARLGVEANALSRPRQELIDAGLIRPAGRGNLRFTVPGFAAYLQGRHEE